jgi:metabolite-proton symporter
MSKTRSPIGKVVGASLIGTTIEWYDFFLYGSAAALVFGKLFFPTSDPLVGTLLAFLTYAIGFAARPIGGIVFGHYGDRIGRKQLLVISLLLMGGSTFAIGLLPTYAQIGVAAPILLTVLRLVQGFALGGEWGGAVLLVAEHGSPERRGFWASWPQAGAPGGNFLGTGVLLLLSAVQSDAAFGSWGWRVAFLLSGVLVAVGLWIRLTVSESPLFLIAAERAAERERHTGVVARPPLAEILRSHKLPVLLAMGARLAENVSYYVITAFVLVYVTTHLHLTKTVGLRAVLIGSAVEFVAIPLWGALSDRVGRKPVYLFGAVGIGLWAWAFFALLDTRSSTSITVAVTVGLVLHGAMYGPQAAFFAELFGTSVRYSGASIGYQLAAVGAGAAAPLIAVALLKHYGSAGPIVVYMVAMSVLSVLALLATRETREVDLAADHPERVARVENRVEATVG